MRWVAGFSWAFALACAWLALGRGGTAVETARVLLEGAHGGAAQKGGRGAPPAVPSFDELAAALRAPHPKTRRGAVRQLAELGTAAAWRLVAEALADPESEVGDEAQIRLGGLADAGVLGELLGKRGLRAKEDVVRLRTAEAVGRMSLPVDGEALASELSRREPEIARALLHSIERLARAERLAGRRERIAGLVERFLRSARSPDLEACALVALAALEPPELEAHLLDALGEKAPALRCAALQAAQGAGLPQAGAWARALAADPERSVRAQALEALETQGTREALAVLVERLAVEPDERLRGQALGVLQRASGLKHRLDPRPWRLWLEGLPADWRAPRAAAGPAVPEASATRAASFAGLPVLSERVCFLFDFSGSMWTPLPDGRTPKDLVARKLREALETLPEESRFNLIPFTNDPLPWEERLVPARRANKKRALEFFERCNARGRGNFYDAALLALEDPEVEALVVLTDGVPTGGTHSRMELIAGLLAERNRFRKVALDAVLVGAPRGCVRWWRALAEGSAGRVVEVEVGEFFGEE